MEGTEAGAAGFGQPSPLAGTADPTAPSLLDDPTLDAAPSLEPVPFSKGDGRQLARWMHIVRAPVLLCSLAPVAISATLLWTEGVRISVPLLVATLGAAVFVQAGANVLDAYLDHLRTQQMVRIDPSSSSVRRFSRSLSALLEADIYPRDAFRAAALLFICGAICGIPLLMVGGWPVVILGVVGALVAVLYSSTNFALKRLPLGEVAVFLGLGPGLVALTLFVQHRAATTQEVAIGIGLGLFALALVEAANLRAVSPEIRDGRLTVVRLLGPWRGRLFFAGCLLGAYLVVAGVALLPKMTHSAVLVLCSFPTAVVPLTGALRAKGAAALGHVVRYTVRAYCLFTFWLVAGLVLGALALKVLAYFGR
ncbi:MAG TPA: prenyltransferase [Ktedonobacterales bacterium]